MHSRLEKKEWRNKNENKYGKKVGIKAIYYCTYSTYGCVCLCGCTESNATHNRTRYQHRYIPRRQQPAQLNYVCMTIRFCKAELFAAAAAAAAASIVSPAPFGEIEKLFLFRKRREKER